MSNERLLKGLVLGMLFVGGALLLGGRAHAQDDSTNTAQNAWKGKLAGRISASQAAYSNWKEGGLNTLSLTGMLEGEARSTTAGWRQEHHARMVFGVVRQDTQAVRKADDLVRLSTSLKYIGDGFFRQFNPTASAQLRTQFAAGFDYDQDPREKVSDIFAPAVFTQSIGLTYDPHSWITQRFGVGLKETIVRIEELRPRYNVEPSRPIRFEAGLDAQTEVDRKVFENVRLESSLGLFAAFNRPDVPDMMWENTMAMKVNSWLGVNLEMVTLYDRDIDARLQFKEQLSLGVSVNLI